jgi:hypothetical protein
MIFEKDGIVCKSQSQTQKAVKNKKRTKRKINKIEKEIRKYQKSTEFYCNLFKISLLIPKLPFARLVRELLKEMGTNVSRFKPRY